MRRVARRSMRTEWHQVACGGMRASLLGPLGEPRVEGATPPPSSRVHAPVRATGPARARSFEQALAAAGRVELDPDLASGYAKRAAATAPTQHYGRRPSTRARPTPARSGSGPTATLSFHSSTPAPFTVAVPLALFVAFATGGIGPGAGRGCVTWLRRPRAWPPTCRRPRSSRHLHRRPCCRRATRPAAT